jgi:hypothetical protein
VQPDHAGRVRLRRRQREIGVHAVGKDPLAAAQDQWIDQQVQLVDEIGRDERLNELAAAVGEDVLAGLRLQRPDPRPCRPVPESPHPAT